MNDEVFDLEESIEPEIPIRNFLRIEERHRGSGPSRLFRLHPSY
jgi:hypothetical protein